MTNRQPSGAPQNEQSKREAIGKKQPEFGHEGTSMEPDEAPQSEEERKPGTTPGRNADSHVGQPSR